MEAKMIDVSGKGTVVREAVAEGEIKLRKETLRLIREGRVEKGDPLGIAKVAGINGSKLTPLLIPLCHNIPIEYSEVTFELLEDGIRARATVRTTAKTGVEMDALTSVSIALLNLWDVVKKYEKDESGQYPDTEIRRIRVVSKVKGDASGGRA